MAHPAEGEGQRVRFSNPKIDGSLAGRVRDVVRGMREDVDPTYTLRQFVEEAFRQHCGLLEDRYHEGKPWPHADLPLDRGRPGQPR